MSTKAHKLCDKSIFRQLEQELKEKDVCFIDSVSDSVTAASWPFHPMYKIFTAQQEGVSDGYDYI